MIRILAILALISVFGPAQAQSAFKSLQTGDDSRGFEAVGRLDFGDRSFCTGTLVSTNLVLTAAHCVFREDGVTPQDARRITFRAGLRNGGANAHRKVVRVFTHDDYAKTIDDRIARISMDLALLELDRPVRNGVAVPFAVSSLPREGATVSVVSYAFDRADRPLLEDRCRVLGREENVSVLSCDVDYGSSGAPVLNWGANGWELVSVISAKAEVEGQKASVGVALGRTYDTLLDQASVSAGRFKRVGVGAGGRLSGTRFLSTSQEP